MYDDIYLQHVFGLPSVCVSVSVFMRFITERACFKIWGMGEGAVISKK